MLGDGLDEESQLSALLEHPILLGCHCADSSRGCKLPFSCYRRAVFALNYLRAAAAAADPAKGRLQHRGKLRGPPGSTVTH